MKRLPPSMQEKERYLKFRIHSREEVEKGDAIQAIWKTCLDYLGTSGVSEAGIWIIGNRFSEEKGEGVIKVTRNSEQDVRAALALLESIDGKKTFLEFTGVSGTLEGLLD